MRDGQALHRIGLDVLDALGQLGAGSPGAVF
jgi:hypothetical protein